MPRLIPFRPAAACSLAFILVLSCAALAVAKGTPAQLRVVAGQKVLADQALRTGTTAVPTSRRAACFGKESVGSGRNARVAGATPLGLLAQAARSNRALRPLLVTDAFSFGLGLCAIGGYEPKGEGFWQLRVGHRASSVGGDAVKLKPRDEVLWYLTAAFPGPAELALRAPERVRAGTAFRVRVLAYSEKGKAEPAAGAKVSGAASRTDAKGYATVTLRRPVRLIARDGKSIPSNRVAVCVGGRCPRG
jgi:hypothetical protein